MQEKALVIDWGTLALEERESIFLRLAEAKRPDYFRTKSDLEVKIHRNMRKVKQMKEELYQTICEVELKIIEDDSCISNA